MKYNTSKGKTSKHYFKMSSIPMRNVLCLRLCVAYLTRSKLPRPRLIQMHRNAKFKEMSKELYVDVEAVKTSLWQYNTWNAHCLILLRLECFSVKKKLERLFVCVCVGGISVCSEHRVSWSKALAWEKTRINTGTSSKKKKIATVTSTLENITTNSE